MRLVTTIEDSKIAESGTVTINVYSILPNRIFAKDNLQVLPPLIYEIELLIA